MAKSGALADFGRLPTSRKVLIFAAIGGFVFFMYYRFVFKGLAEDRDKAEKAYNAAAQKNDQLEKDLPAFAKLRKQKDELDDRFKKVQKALPTEAEISAFFETIERKLTDAGVADMKFSAKNEEPFFNEFVKVPLNVEITGTFMQIKRFFASLIEKQKLDEKGRPIRDRIVSIENLSLTNPVMRNRELVLTARFTAVTFRQQTAAPPPGTGSGMPADAPAPTKLGGNNPAPTNIVDESKQRVEDAVQRQDERQRQKEAEAKGMQEMTPKTLLDDGKQANP
jgi:Tfp pilus assembly protein PilO